MDADKKARKAEVYRQLVERRRSLGMSQVAVWVPTVDAVRVQRFASELRQRHIESLDGEGGAGLAARS